ncbi:MAG: translation initiation factor IF-2 [Parcubacteria group bacterium]
MAESRPPIIAIMGHIDHGKSTLLDFIRKTNTTEKEAGGITQHVSAYEVIHKIGPVTKKLTFMDTPGHEAFQGIRERGAKAADIVVLVVSAEDGVKPQTLEAYKYIKKSETPFVVAITKIDKPSANIEHAKQSLAENDIYVEGYGGNIPVVNVSAITGDGVEELLEMLLLVSDLEHFTADKKRLGSGVIIESRLDPKKGVTAVGIIKDGTVKTGMVAASVGAIVPLRYLLNAEGEQVNELSFSSPVQIIGWDNPPPVGARFEVFEDKREAQFYAESEAAKVWSKEVLETLPDDMSTLPLIIKADTAGSLEAIVYEISKLNRERIMPKVIIKAVGTIGEGDVKAAITTPGTIIFAFHTKVDAPAASLADRSDIVIENFDIIYKLTERIEALLGEKEPRIEVEEIAGSAKVLKVFSVQKDKQVLGARALTGEFVKGGSVRIMRREAEIGRGKIKELQQSKMAVESITEGREFGLLLESKMGIAPGDVLERVILVTK